MSQNLRTTLICTVVAFATAVVCLVAGASALLTAAVIALLVGVTAGTVGARGSRATGDPGTPR